MTHKTYPKEAPVRSESYRRWVASLPCIVCGVDGYSQAAHPNKGKGMALKTSDLLCFPLCGPRGNIPGCHAEHDRGAFVSREDRRNAEELWSAKTYAEAIRQGRKELW